MKHALNSLIRHQFFTVSTGVIGSNLISLLAMPWLTRLYPAESFGYFAIYYAIANLVGMVATLRLEMAIPIAPNDEDADKLTLLPCLLAIGAGAGFALIALFKPMRDLVYAFPSDYSMWFATGVSIVGVGWLQAFTLKTIRAGNLKYLSYRHIAERLVFVIFAVGLAKLEWSKEGLVFAQSLAITMAFVMLYLGSKIKLSLSIREIPELFSRYADFPKKNMPSIVLQICSTQLPVVVYSYFFSAAEIGFLNLAQRLIDAPNTIVGSSLGTVYYRRLLGVTTSEYRRIFRRTLLWSVGLFGIPCLVAGVFATPLMTWAFGDQWQASALFFVALLPSAFARLVYICHQNYLYVMRRLDLELTTSILVFAAQASGLILGLTLSGTLLTPVTISSALTAVSLMTSLGLIYRLVKQL